MKAADLMMKKALSGAICTHAIYQEMPTKNRKFNY
jgi:hypothetical protein